MPVMSLMQKVGQGSSWYILVYKLSPVGSNFHFFSCHWSPTPARILKSLQVDVQIVWILQLCTDFIEMLYSDQGSNLGQGHL